MHRESLRPQKKKNLVEMMDVVQTRVLIKLCLKVRQESFQLNLKSSSSLHLSMPLRWLHRRL